MSSIATPSFSDIPQELKHNIMTYCEAQELAVLSRTARRYKPEAERLLYGTISLHYRCPASFDCIRVLASNKRKAKLVQAFALTLWNDSSLETDRYAGDAKCGEKTQTMTIVCNQTNHTNTKAEFVGRERRGRRVQFSTVTHHTKPTPRRDYARERRRQVYLTKRTEEVVCLDSVSKAFQFPFHESSKADAA
ncbi:hypothetical protein DFP72DRAFT_854266 [Ephemerocybe angulata]|uniref:F-box domain-containing protein n=1 Tax=Ephemerocybe angulata TaxID=980116 RepID=A0A8H6HKK7_9AGAR|nr:hypothetical protein DFP72DRAFT_854266 [Tulosesus angulatus]